MQRFANNQPIEFISIFNRTLVTGNICHNTTDPMGIRHECRLIDETQHAAILQLSGY